MNAGFYLAGWQSIGAVSLVPIAGFVMQWQQVCGAMVMIRYEQQLRRLFLSHSFELQCWGSATLARTGKHASRNLSNSLFGELNMELIMSECNMVHGCIALHM